MCKKQALRTEKWIIAIACRMCKLSNDDNFSHKEYMCKIDSLIKVMKIYINKLDGYHTVSKGIEKRVVNSSKRLIGNLVLGPHEVGNILTPLWAYGAILLKEKENEHQKR